MTVSGQDSNLYAVEFMKRIAVPDCGADPAAYGDDRPAGIGLCGRATRENCGLMFKRRFSGLLFIAALLGASVAAFAQQNELPPLPPLTDPATAQHIPGKFVWADLFTSDMDAARTFYSQLFGWEWRWVSDPPHPYGIFYKDGFAVAGLAFRKADGQEREYGRWAHYISVADVAAMEAAIIEKGGRALLPKRSLPNRGDIAILATPDEAVIGIIHSSSGDPGDYRPEVGEFLWHELFTRDVTAAAEFYESLFGYEVLEKADTAEIVDYFLASGEHSRGGIGSLSPESDTVPTWLGYIRVDNVDQAVERVKALGGEVLVAPDPANINGDLAIVADPVGTPIGLIRWEFPEEQEAQQ